jgi:mRNA interferase RelE/StbE
VSYGIEFRPAAARSLAKLDRKAQRRVQGAIELLADNPRPPGARMLAGSHGLLRVRTGDYRIIYLVQDAVLIVLVVAVGHRREVYRPRG